ncbi:MAG: alpha/beta hydrolase, partial [Planctomycetota bacterium]
RARRLACFLTLACVLGGCHEPTGDSGITGKAAEVTRIETAHHSLVVHTRTSDAGGGDPTLVVLLHGDLPTPPPDYHVRVASEVANRHLGVVAAALLRPGYGDGSGNTSSGPLGRATGDGYTSEVVDSVAGAIRHLQSEHGARCTVVVGHSGGGAIAALVASRHHGLVHQLLVVGCPCDLGAWRVHMGRQRPGVDWDTGESLSPIEVAQDMDPAVAVGVIVGEDDDVAPPAISDSYARELESQGIRATLTRLPGAGHNILTSPRVGELIDAAIAACDR